MKKVILLLLMCFLFTGCKQNDTNEAKKYDIYFDTLGMVSSPEFIDDVTNIPYFLPDLTCEGYDFVGWYYDEACTRKVILGKKNSEIGMYRKTLTFIQKFDHYFTISIGPYK